MWERSAFVHRLLELLEDWPGSPQFFEIDDEQREILSFIPGRVAWKTSNRRVSAPTRAS